MDLNPRLDWTINLDALLWSSRTCPACKLLCIALKPYKLRPNAGPVTIGIELVNGMLKIGFYVSSQDGQGSSPPFRQSEMDSTGRALAVSAHRILGLFVKSGASCIRFHGSSLMLIIDADTRGLWPTIPPMHAKSGNEVPAIAERLTRE